MKAFVTFIFVVFTLISLAAAHVYYADTKPSDIQPQYLVATVHGVRYYMHTDLLHNCWSTTCFEQDIDMCFTSMMKKPCPHDKVEVQQCVEEIDDFFRLLKEAKEHNYNEQDLHTLYEILHAYVEQTEDPALLEKIEAQYESIFEHPANKFEPNPYLTFYKNIYQAKMKALDGFIDQLSKVNAERATDLLGSRDEMQINFNSNLASLSFPPQNNDLKVSE